MGKAVERPRIKKLTTLTIGESLLLYRKANRLNQTQMAKKIKISVDEYKKIEYDIISPELKLGWLKERPLSAHEKCLIHRRRAGLHQRDVAAKIGISRYWLGQQERGAVDCTRLLAFWTKQT